MRNGYEGDYFRLWRSHSVPYYRDNYGRIFYNVSECDHLERMGRQMQELIKEYGESVSGAVAVIAAIGLFAFIFLSRSGALHSLVTFYCGYLL